LKRIRPRFGCSATEDIEALEDEEDGDDEEERCS
jgi:hypothetical protein